jgi:hypothetical protein
LSISVPINKQEEIKNNPQMVAKGRSQMRNVNSDFLLLLFVAAVK